MSLNSVFGQETDPMSSRSVIRLAVVLGTVGVLGLVTVPSANATITINLGGLTATSPAGTVPPDTLTATITPSSTTFDGVPITVQGVVATQDINGTTGCAETNTVTIQLHNDSTTTAVDVPIVVTADSFLAPNGPVTVTNSFGTSVVDTGSSVDFTATAGSIGPLPTLTLVGAGQATVSPPPVSLGGSLTTPYTVIQTITAHLLPGAGINFSATTTTCAVPEPGSLAMTFLALPLLGFGYRRFRRRGE